METFLSVAGDLVFLDTMCFVYHWERNPRYVRRTSKVFRAVESGQLRGITSVLTVHEVLTGVKGLPGGPETADQYLEVFRTFPNLHVLDLDVACAQISSDLRGRYPRIRTPDALQLACALNGRASSFLTNDVRLRNVAEIRVLILGEL